MSEHSHDKLEKLLINSDLITVKPYVEGKKILHVHICILG